MSVNTDFAIEMEEFPRSSERHSMSVDGGQDDASKTLIRKEHQEKSWLGRKCSCYETSQQCPSMTCACFSTAMVVASVVAIILGYVLLNNTSNSDDAIGGVCLGVGSACLVNFFLNCGVHTHSCWAIQHYIPEQAFENNIARLNMENNRLKEENVQLKTNADRLEQLAEGQNQYADRQVKLTSDLGDMLKTTSAELDAKKVELSEQLQRLEELEKKAEKDKAYFDKRLGEAKMVVETLKESNIKLRELLEKEGVACGDYKDLEAEWGKDIGLFDGENDEYKEQNAELKRMMEEARKELEQIIKMRDEIRASGENIKENVAQIRELTEKLEIAQKKLEETQKISKELKACKEINELYKQVIEYIEEKVTDEEVKKYVSNLLDKINEITESLKTGQPSEVAITEVDEMSDAD